MAAMRAQSCLATLGNLIGSFCQRRTPTVARLNSQAWPETANFQHAIATQPRLGKSTTRKTAPDPASRTRSTRAPSQ